MPKQVELPGTEKMRKHPAVHKAAIAYAAARDARMEHGREEVERKAELIAKMKEAELPSYIHGNVEVILDQTDTVTVKIRDDEP